MLKTTIVLTNNIDESEKLKSLASFHEVTFDTRYMTSLELAEYLLQLSGVIYPQTFISNDDLAARLYTSVKEIPYLKKFTYNDVLGLIEAIEDLRFHILDNEEENIFSKLPMDKFVNKNSAVKQVYSKLKEFLDKNNYIDEVGVIRYAISHIKPFNDIEFIKYERSHLRPLEDKLLSLAAGHPVNETKICEDKPLKIKRYTKSFGATNEIEDIINYIYKNNLHFDECLIASASEKDYATILTNYKDLVGFPLTIGKGKMVTLTPPGRIFNLIYEFKDNHYHKEYLKRIIYSECFDIENFQKDLDLPENFDEINKKLDYQHQVSFDFILTSVGDLKASFKKEENDKKVELYTSLINSKRYEEFDGQDSLRRRETLPYVLRFIEILNKGIPDFIKRYSLVKDLKADSSALGKILKGLSYLEYGVLEDDIRKIISNQSVSREKPQEGALYFTSISNASSCLRKHLFLTGLSSNNFPGKSVENPMLLDRDYLPFGVKDASNTSINNNKDDYFALLEAAKKYDVDIYISWASYNEQTLKDQNSSSVVFETYKLENGEDKTLSDFEKEFKDKNDKYRFIEFFNDDLLPINTIGKALNEDKDIAYNKFENTPNDTEVKVETLLNKKGGFSASAVGSFAECPYKFYLQYVLGLSQPQEIDTFEIIPANDYGSLAHSLLEHLDKKDTSKEKFIELAKSLFDDYLIIHQTDNLTLAKKAKKDFVDMMSIAYDMEGDEVTAFREEDVYCVHDESQIKIHGFPDKVIKNSDGTYRVVDYKTGRKQKHFVYEPSSMIQCTMYSYILEKIKKVKVTSFEYRYIRLNTSVYSNDGDPNKFTMQYHYDNLTATLLELKKALETGNFEPNTDKCRGCYFKDICLKKGKK